MEPIKLVDLPFEYEITYSDKSDEKYINITAFHTVEYFRWSKKITMLEILQLNSDNKTSENLKINLNLESLFKFFQDYKNNNLKNSIKIKFPRDFEDQNKPININLNFNLLEKYDYIPVEKIISLEPIETKFEDKINYKLNRFRRQLDTLYTYPKILSYSDFNFEFKTLFWFLIFFLFFTYIQIFNLIESNKKNNEEIYSLNQLLWNYKTDYTEKLAKYGKWTDILYGIISANNLSASQQIRFIKSDILDIQIQNKKFIDYFNKTNTTISEQFNLVNCELNNINKIIRKKTEK